MTLYGGDLAQLDVLARRLTEEVSAIDGMQGRIGAAMQATAWTGPAADRFRDRWNGEFVPALNRLREALAEQSATVARRRQAIETATS